MNPDHDGDRMIYVNVDWRENIQKKAVLIEVKITERRRGLCAMVSECRKLARALPTKSLRRIPTIGAHRRSGIRDPKELTHLARCGALLWEISNKTLGEHGYTA
jgi:hypothetical protein